MESKADLLELWDYRRRVHQIYRRVREQSDPAAAWEEWRSSRDDLFAHHPQSPVPPDGRSAFRGLPYFAYDPAWRFEAVVTEVPASGEEVSHSGAGRTRFIRFGEVQLDTPVGEIALSLYWLDTYGGGVFLPFRDATNGEATYGGGRYLLDTAKGADMGHHEHLVVLDFNFAYHPSCVHDPAWSCPLAPSHNRLQVPIEAGERLRQPRAPEE